MTPRNEQERDKEGAVHYSWSSGLGLPHERLSAHGVWTAAVCVPGCQNMISGELAAPATASDWRYQRLVPENESKIGNE